MFARNHQIMISSKNRPYFIATGILALSVSLFSGCKDLTGAEIPVIPNSPSAPQSPLVVDGARTSYADIVERSAPAVVKVNSERKGGQRPSAQGGGPQLPFPFGNQAPPQQRGPSIQRGVGSGVIVSADGTILTNNHVIEGADKVQIEMNDKRSFEARVIGTDKLSDMAVLKVEAKDLPFLNLGNSDNVRIGDVVLAIGNPLGLGQTVTAGIISAKGRRTGLSDGSFEDFLQTDAPINRGNSGGALINVSGELIGINSQILSTGGGFGSDGGNIGIGFSIPSNMAKTVMDQLVKDGKVHRGQLGVIVQNVTAEFAEDFNIKGLDGVIVAEVKKGGAAEKAGVKRGDVILTLNGEKVEDSNALRNRVAASAPGSEVTLKIQRDGAEQEIKAKLEEASQDTPGASEGGENNKPENAPGSGGKLGITVNPSAEGLEVSEVDPEGAAAEAGIRKGDVIVEVNRQAVKSLDEMRTALDKSSNRALLLVSRSGQTVYLSVPFNN